MAALSRLFFFFFFFVFSFCPFFFFFFSGANPLIVALLSIATEKLVDWVGWWFV